MEHRGSIKELKEGGYPARSYPNVLVRKKGR